MPSLILQRFAYHPEGTLGVLLASVGHFYTVEKPWEDNTPFKSCIPEGEYPMNWERSPKFGMCWHVKDVPNRTHILIHAGNTARDVVGCVAVGRSLLGDTIGVSESRKAMAELEGITTGGEWTLKVEFVKDAALNLS
jgi:hypothetical protein